MIPIIPERYLQPHQARTRPATSFEDLLGDSLERAFGAGHWELDALLTYLNQAGPLAQGGVAWTAQSFQATMQKLGT